MIAQKEIRAEPSVFPASCSRLQQLWGQRGEERARLLDPYVVPVGALGVLGPRGQSWHVGTDADAARSVVRRQSQCMGEKCVSRLWGAGGDLAHVDRAVIGVDACQPHGGCRPRRGPAPACWTCG